MVLTDSGLSLVPARLLQLFIVIQLISHVNSANWAQASGAIQQNVAIPYYPSASNPHWGPRYGMVTIVKPPVAAKDTGELFLLGGDTYTGDKTQRDLIPGKADYTWEHGYKNDVWQMTGTNWYMKGDLRLRTQYKQKIPRVESQLKWESVTAGLRPPLGITTDKWIECADFFKNTSNYITQNCANLDPVDMMWSPRRHHAGVFFNDRLYIMGGRAREFVPLPEERAIGGILGPRVQDVQSDNVAEAQVFSQQREAIITKNDVWSSPDGRFWTLVTPGCKINQHDQMLAGNPHDGLYGDAAKTCVHDSDCYGAEVCDHVHKTCACPMWSPREQHALAAFNDYMYISGGYVSVQAQRCGGYMCGDTDASSNRYYMSDIWRSKDGLVWEQMNHAAFVAPNPMWGQGGPVSLGRGGHQMMIFEYGETPYMWIFGGRGNDNKPGSEEIYFNEVWVASLHHLRNFTLMDGVAPLPNASTNWHSIVPRAMTEPPPWRGRVGHSMAMLPISGINPYTRVLVLYGGYVPDNNGTFLDDCWTFRIDDPNERWREDFTSDELFSSGYSQQFLYFNNSPTTAYVTAGSDVSYLTRFWVPAKPKKGKGSRLEKRPYMSPEKVGMLYSVGINTINDLAEIDLYTVLKLRGFDYPQVPKDQRLNFYDICDYRALAMALVEKCTVNLPSLYDGERNMPWNIQNVFGGSAPVNDSIAWHGRQHFVPPIESVDDILTLTAEWDGCTYMPAIQGLFGPNVDGLGTVDQVLSITDPLPTLQELFCRQYPQGRGYHSLVVFQQTLYIMGGKQTNSEYYADTWYRDDNLPVSVIRKKPRANTPDEWFQFVSDEPGVFFEYRIWDPYSYKELREWTPVTHKTSIAWLDWRMGGPGNGYYQLYVRAVDPAGNRDESYIMGSNVYQWYYVSPTPWDIIAEVIGGFLGLCIIAYLEYRRRVKKAAMERYAMKRMRRKFKAMQRDINGKAVDWRTLYTEQKELEELNGIVKTKKKNKKSRDKNADKREKEKKKREKEKELIKKKLKATKDLKKGPVGIQEAVPIGMSNKSGKGGKGGKKSKVDVVEGDEVDQLEQEYNDELVKKGGKLGGPRKQLKKSKVAIEQSPEEMFLDKSNLKGGPQGQLITRRDGQSAKPAPGKGSQLVIEGSTKEIRAGELRSSKDTEKGVKQRKVNKKLSSYEDAPVLAQQVEEKEDPDEHKNKDN